MRPLGKTAESGGCRQTGGKGPPGGNRYTKPPQFRSGGTNQRSGRGAELFRARPAYRRVRPFMGAGRRVHANSQSSLLR
jgi:hypothetical protein